MSIILRSHPDGWCVTECLQRGPWNGRYQLRGLHVPREVAEEVITRGRMLGWSRVPLGGGGYVMMLDLTPEEAHAIWYHGCDPLAVVLPPFYARALTLGELMRA